MDGFWLFLTIVSVAGIIESFLAKIAKIKSLSRKADQASAVQNTEWLARLEKLERRMANIETIVLESEKHKQFERAL